MPSLVQHRCSVHPAREASARCPSCRQFFCRECVTEHDDRLLCAACLRRSAAPAKPTQSRPDFLRWPVPIALGLLMAWTAFFLLGQILLTTPSTWHEGKAVESLLLGP